MKYLVNSQSYGLRAGSVPYLRIPHTIEPCFDEVESPRRTTIRLPVRPPRCRRPTEKRLSCSKVKRQRSRIRVVIEGGRAVSKAFALRHDEQGHEE
jgi:hypothetical protein